jgi:hypothetical protein
MMQAEISPHPKLFGQNMVKNDWLTSLHPFFTRLTLYSEECGYSVR